MIRLSNLGYGQPIQENSEDNGENIPLSLPS